jgi:D-glycero-D-manno-heptose 1,7-bisphosphate phosphatase
MLTPAPHDLTATKATSPGLRQTLESWQWRSRMLERALFLDRDGVVNREIGYVIHQEDIEFVDGIFSLCRTARALGYRLVIVTNQAGIARGFYTEAEYHALMEWMRGEFRLHECPLDGVYHSPYHPVHGKGEWKQDHEDRKPGAGMLRRAARDLHLSLQDSVMVGDRCTDIGAAIAGGVRQAFLLRGTEPGPCGGRYMEVDSLAEVETWLRDLGESHD